MSKENVIAVVCADKHMHKSNSNFRVKLEEALGTDDIYTIGFPGADRLVSEDTENTRKGLEAIEYFIAENMKALANNGATHVKKVVVAHSNCAGYPVSDNEHVESVKKLSEKFTDDLDLTVGFTPYMAYRVDENDDNTWVIERV